MDDLRRAKEEMRGLREELQKMRDERDKLKNRNHRIPVECYEIIKQHGLQSDLSLTTLQHFDTLAAVKRLEGHAQHMQKLFARDSYDLAATVQNVIAEIQFVKTNMGGDTLHWRLYSALSLMQHISTALQKALSCKVQEAGFESTRSKVFCDDYLRSTLKTADVQLLSTLNEIRERGMDDYYLAFRERFAPEYDVVHHEYALEFYEKTKALMIHMYSQRRALIVPQNTTDEALLRDKKKKENGGNSETVWI
ncbi:hypothetical protein N0V94_005868 [Neodidymelliopsis sp. IMI 364377]|nr:hypothetical protein N0V94_005868 [Neodidymelliopsis sp. IMI 364377]